MTYTYNNSILGDYLTPSGNYLVVENPIVIQSGSINNTVIGNSVASSGNFSSLTVNNTGVSLIGHTHPISEITDFSIGVSGLLPSVSGSGFVVISSFEDNVYTISVTGVQPSGNYSVDGHTHIISEVSGLQTALDNKQPSGVYASGVHSHVVADITDFSIGVSGLLPTIANSDDNRLLTSDGTSTGINAESNFTFNNNNSSVNLIRFNDTNAGGRPTINLTRNRGTSSIDQLPLNSGDSIGSLLWTTINSSGTYSVAAEISALTPEGLSGYSIPPTQLRIGTRLKNGDISFIYVYDDGTLNPKAGTIINDNAKSIAFGNTRRAALQVFNSASLEQNETSEGSLSWSLGISDADSTHCSVVGGTTLAFITIPSGVINSGVLIGHNVAVYRNAFESDDNGSLDFAIAQNMQYGHVWGDSTNTNTSQFKGISLTPVAGVGTIQSAYDIFLGNTVYDTIIDASGTIKYGTGTITNRYGIYQESADPNVLNGSLTVNNGLSAPTPIHNLGTVSGNVSISYSIDKQIQTLSLNGTNTNFIEGTGWSTGFTVCPNGTYPVDNWFCCSGGGAALDESYCGSDGPYYIPSPSPGFSMDVLLEITVTALTSVTWTMVDDFYNSVPATLSVGKYLVLLRNIGATMQGHYIGEKTN